MRRVVSLFIIALLYITISCTSAATVDAMQLYFNGKYVVLENSNPMIVCDGRAFIPLRVITELIGYDIEWNPFTKEIIINEDEVFLKMQIGNSLYYVGDQVKEFDVDPFIWSNRSYVPIRLLEALGLSVEFNKEYNTVILEKDGHENIKFNDNGIRILASSINTIENNTILELKIQNNSPQTLEKGEVVLGIYSDFETVFYRINEKLILSGSYGFFTKELSREQFDNNKQLYTIFLLSSVNQTNFTEIMGWPPTIIIDLQ